jgi:hypothetical protein
MFAAIAITAALWLALAIVAVVEIRRSKVMDFPE